MLRMDDIQADGLNVQARTQNALALASGLM
jgi:hypothetical protein